MTYIRKRGRQDMHEIHKLPTLIKATIVVLVVLAGIMSYTRNYYKPVYERTKAISYAEVDSDVVGYPAGEDIPIAKSVEDIKKYEYFTIEISEENIMSTRCFKIKEESKAGIKTNRTTSGRHRSSSTIKILQAFSYKQDLKGDIRYKLRQLRFNMEQVGYGEYFIVTLESGEKVKVWMDPLLLDIKKKEYIKLPVCTYSMGNYYGTLDKLGEQQGVSEENKSLYIDAIGRWEQQETETVDPFEQLMITFIIIAVILAIVIYVNAKIKSKIGR